MQIQRTLVPQNRQLSLGILAGLAALMLAIAGWFLGMLANTELAVSDLRACFATTPASGETVIVGIDQETLSHFGGWPISRNRSATVLRQITEAGARRIYVDSSFAEASQVESDVALEEAFERLGPDRVALPVVTLKGKPDANGERKPVEVASLERFTNHTTMVSADMPFDIDSSVRCIGRDAFGNTAKQPTAAAWLALGAEAQPGIVTVDYSINLETIPVISFKDIAQGNFEANALKGKNVVVGLVAERITQPVHVPRHGNIERAKFMALAAETLILDREPVAAHFGLVIACSATLVVLLGLCLPRCGISIGAAVTLLAVVILFAFGVELQRRTQISVPLALPMAAIILTYVGTLIATHPDFKTVRQAGLSLIDKVDYGLARLFHSGVDAIITFSPEGRILTVNEAAEQLFEIKADEVVGQHLSAVLPDSADDLLSSASGHQPGRLEATVNNNAGQGKHVDLAFNAVPSETGWVGYASIRDISAMKAREDEFKRQATHDGMTGLPNRAAFERHLDATRRFAGETGSSFAVFLMDLNKFKQVNDTLGHQIGDELLIEVAKRFTGAVRKGDFVARLGGDEFAVVVAPPSDCDNAEWLASRLVESLADLTELGGHAIETGTSVGISLFPEHAQTSADLVRVADEAMYVAKRGGDGYAMADESVLEAV